MEGEMKKLKKGDIVEVLSMSNPKKSVLGKVLSKERKEVYKIQFADKQTTYYGRRDYTGAITLTDPLTAEEVFEVYSRLVQKIQKFQYLQLLLLG